MFYLIWHPNNKDINMSWQPIGSPICWPASRWLDRLDKWWRDIFHEGHTPEMGSWGGEKREERIQGIVEWAATWQRRVIWLVEVSKQPGRETRKCNSERLSEYDISGSYSICSQTLKWRLAWHGGREVTTVSSLPVNPATPTVEKKIWRIEERKRIWGDKGREGWRMKWDRNSKTKRNKFIYCKCYKKRCSQE